MSKLPWKPLVVFFLVSPVQGQSILEWRLEKGETFFAERIYTQKQSVALKGKAFTEQRTQKWLSALTVKDKTPAGYILDVNVESVSFHTARPPISPPWQAGLGDQIPAKLKGSRFTITLTRQGQLTQIQGYDAFILKLAEKAGDLEKALKALLPEEALRNDIEGIFPLLPREAVGKGDRWKRDASEPVPPFGSFQTTFEYALEEDRGDELAVGYAIKMAYKPPGGAGDFFRVVKGSLKGENGRGTLVFDAKKGRLVTSEHTVHVRGELTVESMGKQVQVEFASDNTARVRVYSKAEAKKDCMFRASALNISHCQVRIDEEFVGIDAFRTFPVKVRMGKSAGALVVPPDGLEAARR